MPGGCLSYFTHPAVPHGTPSGHRTVTPGPPSKIYWKKSAGGLTEISGDSSRMIERRSTDIYKGKPAGRWPANSRAFTCRSPQDHPAVSMDDHAGICRFTSWIPHSSIKAGLWWMISQDEHTSRWILLSQFMLQFKFTNNGQSKEEQGQEEQG